MKKFLLVVVLLITPFILSGCYDGLVSDEEYPNLIAGIEATKDNGETVNYSINILKDETHFNDEIESAVYCKLEIRQVKKCKIKGVCFYVRSSQDCTLDFSIFTNDNLMQSSTKETQSFVSEEITFFFDESVILDDYNKLYIQVDEQLKNETDTRTSFVFDTLIIFFEEV